MFYFDKDVNQKYKFTAPNHLLLVSWGNDSNSFCAFVGFGKSEPPTKKLRSKTKFIIVKENSVT